MLLSHQFFEVSAFVLFQVGWFTVGEKVTPRIEYLGEEVVPLFCSGENSSSVMTAPFAPVVSDPSVMTAAARAPNLRVVFMLMR